MIRGVNGILWRELFISTHVFDISVWSGGPSHIMEEAWHQRYVDYITPELSLSLFSSDQS